jgi:hypothetical protein
MGYNPRILNWMQQPLWPLVANPHVNKDMGTCGKLSHEDPSKTMDIEMMSLSRVKKWLVGTQKSNELNLLSILYLYLIGGLEHFLFFHSVGNVTIPTVTHSIIFQRGRAQPPTRYYMIYTMWGPQDISWFISPSNYSYKYHKP